MLALAAPAQATDQAALLTLHYQERPPYSSLQPDGRVSGLVATPAAAALDKAGIRFTWQLTPSQRQLALIQSGSGLHCGVGWYSNPERATKGRFSAPLYRDQPLAALVLATATLPPGTRSVDLLAAPRLRLLVKDGYSYGVLLDGQIAAHPQAVTRTNVDPPQMSRMVRQGRADWMIVAPEEATVLGGDGLRRLPLSDVPAGQTRHLYCNNTVDPGWLERINRVLAAPGR